MVNFEDGERLRCNRVVRVKGMLTDTRLLWVRDREICSVRNSPVLANTEVELEGSLPNVDSITTVTSKFVSVNIPLTLTTLLHLILSPSSKLTIMTLREKY